MKRKIIEIDEEKCTGCGLCIPGCPEGALQIIDEKARIVSDLLCDGLGACVGECPEDALRVVEKEAEPYDERKVMERIIPQGKNTIIAHLNHLKEHGEISYLKEALEVLRSKDIKIDFNEKNETSNVPPKGGCPGARTIDFMDERNNQNEEGKRISQLRQWPVQLHLISPNASYFKGNDVLIAADCVAYSLGDFHKDFLKGKSLAIACPKLDSNQEIYIQKIKSLIEDSKINTLTIMTMEVPCCRGLVHIAKNALEQSSRKVPVKNIIVSIKGDILKNEWL